MKGKMMNKKFTRNDDDDEDCEDFPNPKKVQYYKRVADFVQRHNLSENFGFIDFNDVNDIVRSDAVRQFIVSLVRDEKKGQI